MTEALIITEAADASPPVRFKGLYYHSFHHFMPALRMHVTIEAKDRDLAITVLPRGTERLSLLILRNEVNGGRKLNEAKIVHEPNKLFRDMIPLILDDQSEDFKLREEV